MRYFIARLEEQVRVREYRIYVTDALRAMIPGSGNIMRYADAFKPPEKRTPEEIKGNIIQKLKEASDGLIHTGGEADA